VHGEAELREVDLTKHKVLCSTELGGHLKINHKTA